MAIGDRVMALESMNDNVVRVYGCGVYEGDFPRPEESDGVFGTTAEMKATAVELWGPEESWSDKQRKSFEASISNPRIRLDNGDVVWGCQCWWGDEEQTKRHIGLREIVIVPVPDKKGACP